VALAQQSLAILKANGMDRHALVGAALSRLSKYHDILGHARLALDFNRQALEAWSSAAHGGTLMQALVLMSNDDRLTL
jgi:transposase